MRKTFFTIIFALIIIGLGWAGYLILNQKSKIKNQKLGKPPIEVNIPVERLDLEKKTTDLASENNFRSVLQILTSTPTAGYWASSNSGDVFLLDYAGRVRQLSSLSKEPIIINENGLRNIFEIKPSADGTKALVNLTIFDTIKKRWLPLPAETTAAAWNPQDSSSSALRGGALADKQKIAYLKNDGLYLLDLTTSKVSSLAKFANRDWQIDWPFVNEIYLYDRPTAIVNSEIWKFDLKSKILAKFLSDEPSLAIKWGEGWGLKLNDASVIDKNGEPLFNLASIIPQESVFVLNKKCAVNAAKIYCALPGNFPVDGLWPDDYLKRKVYTNDNIYLIDIDLANRTAKTKVLWLADDNNPIDAYNISLQEGRILFVNRYDQKLYDLKIK